MPLSNRTLDPAFVVGMPLPALMPLIVVPLVVKFPRFVRVRTPLPTLVMLLAELPVVTLTRPPPAWGNGNSTTVTNAGSGTVNLGVSQNLSSVSIGTGTVVTFGDGLPFSQVGD